MEVKQLIKIHYTIWEQRGLAVVSQSMAARTFELDLDRHLCSLVKCCNYLIYLLGFVRRQTVQAKSVGTAGHEFCNAVGQVERTAACLADTSSLLRINL